MRTKKIVDIDLDIPRQLKLNMNTVASFEERTGKSIGAVKDELGRVPMSTFRVLLWALLVTDEPTLTIEEAGARVDFDNLKYVTDKISEVMSSANKGASVEAAVPLQSTQLATVGASS